MKPFFPQNPGLFFLGLYTVSILVFFIFQFLIIGKGSDLDKYCITDLNFYGEYPLNYGSKASFSMPKEKMNLPLKKKL